MKSIRARLLVWLLGAVVLTGMAGGWQIYRNALAEANAFFDYQLRQTALTLRDQSFQYALPPDLTINEPGYDFVVQVWSLDGVRIYLSEPHTVLPGITTLGFSTVDTTAGQWRVFGVQARRQVIQVAQPIGVRSEQAARLALRTLLPFAWFVPLLGIAIWFLVGFSLRPLDRLAGTVEARDPASLQPLPDSSLPEEARPLVASLNTLLGRLNSVLQRERAFIADAAHELRTPLTALRLQVDAVGKSTDPDERSQAVQQLAAGVERSSRLVEQLLSLARQDPGIDRPHVDVSLDRLAADVIAEMVPVADRKSVDVGLDDTPPVQVKGDEDSLRTLVRNLVDNAIRYTPPGGKVDVSLSATRNQVLLRVTDTGPGIPPSDRSRVFDRFVRLPNSGPIGSGLGLAIVRTIAEAHGASVELGEGPAGRGLAVTVRFPVR
jgi:two-component system OmpR family sensor kinase